MNDYKKIVFIEYEKINPKGKEVRKVLYFQN